MTVQARSFEIPQPLGPRLAQDPPRINNIPRSVPIQEELAKPTDYLKRASSYQRVPMDDYNENDRNKPDGVTFSAQDKLPKLPIPDLEHTTERYLKALKPLQSAREHLETQNAVYDFLHNEGPDLQEKLKTYAQSKTSYIEQFWYDSYLNYDNPVVLNLNPFFLLEDDPTPARNDQVTRAASLVASSLEFVRAVRKEELPPDSVKGTPLCMYQFSRLFGTARVPTEAGCQIQQDPSSKHMVVMCHGQLYWFDVLDDNSDAIMTERDIALNLQTIVDDAQQIPIQEAAKGAVGVLSTENRKVWSGLRDLLTREYASNNADSLNIVDSALFVLCLDYTEPADVAALCQNMLCGTSLVEKGVQIGTCTNRWYDKLQIIVCKNGSAGINFEHTGVDGHTVLRFASDVYTDTILRFARTINGKAPSMWASTSPDPSKRDPSSFGDVNTTPRKLEWDMIPELSIAVRFAETRLADLIEQNEFQCLDFDSFGKNFITSMGFSPDAFVQMAFQAAYYGLYGKVECTYEPAMTKVYLHGRTEAIRPVTDESLDFVQSFWADHPAEKKLEALRKACQKHVNSTRECAKGQGCDRHLYALLCVWQKYVNEASASGRSSNGWSSPLDGDSERDAPSPVGNSSNGISSSGATSKNGDHHNGDTLSAQGTMSSIEVNPSGRERGDSNTSRSSRGRDNNTPLPLLFADPGWDRLNTTVLSTSNCGNPALRHFGFGPTSGDGFGIGYIIKDEGISICVSSKHRQTRRFLDTLESYLLEIRRMLRITNRKASQAKTSRAREAEDSNSIVKKNGTSRASNSSRLKSRGRLVTADPTRPFRQHSFGTRTPTEESVTLSEDDDELGGYGFFDAGMLLQALKARGKNYDNGETKPSERAVVQARRRDVGKKLHLNDY
ncbi:hypothetical protein GMORB2_6310 [Geosmithia morbida]|uniref:Choline/carnitine acyltransferase domain-containing protein n=1 Tax=Geosmithia morbida TaxID=1094350 RepID=A0A9P4YXI0_9HYPO|nr:uncharacterized protein GMORB2_6310 [Geosmithia morbida]KAF4123609.1 hypothetical protein GMORB2_6310 [Geosmithia morbida]